MREINKSDLLVVRKQIEDILGKINTIRQLKCLNQKEFEARLGKRLSPNPKVELLLTIAVALNIELKDFLLPEEQFIELIKDKKLDIIDNAKKEKITIIYDTITDRLRYIRNMHGLRLEDLGKKIWASLYLTYINEKKYNRNIRMDYLLKVCRASGQDISFFTGKNQGV